MSIVARASIPSAASVRRRPVEGRTVASRSDGSRGVVSRRGAALLVVLVAIGVLGLMAAALAVETRADQTAARRAVAARHAADAAAAALADALAAWPDAPRLALATGASHVAASSSTSSSTSSSAPPLAVTTVTTRLAPALFSLTATAEVRPAGAARPEARRRETLLVALEPTMPSPRAALTTAGDALGGGAVRLDGRDTLPAGWGCDPADSASVAALRHAPGVVAALPAGALAGLAPLVAADGGAARPAAYGPPPPARAPAFDAARPLRLPGAVAPSIGPVLDASGACAAGPLNWGDPARPAPCAGHLPLVVVEGDLVAPRGRGQGMLVVRGDLVLRGGWEHHGVVVVGGRLDARGAGNRVLGAVLARGRAGVPHRVDALDVRWSSCVEAAARRAAGAVRPARGRAWSDAW